jgi:phosphate starvation-inducible PhoH-like protein
MAKRNGVKKPEEGLIFRESEIVEQHKEKVNSVLNTEIKVIAKNESQKELIRSIKGNEITICTGKAGTGKTYVSLAFALQLLRNRNNKFNKLYLIKSVTTLRDEGVGFLKGSLQEKLEPFMWSFYINMEKMMGETEMRQLLDYQLVRPFPLAYARGTTLDNALIIADEMQNVSLDNARTLLTRIGKNSKMMLLGDSNQIDLKIKKGSSLEPLMSMFNGVENIGCVRMDDNDVNVRNPLINIIEEKFKYYVDGDNSNHKIPRPKIEPEYIRNENK